MLLSAQCSMFVLLISTAVFLSGCSNPPEPPPIPGTGGSTSSEKSEQSGEESPFDEDGWMSFDEAIGDESRVELKVTPTQPKAGESVKIEVKAGSVYGRFRGKAWVRVGKSFGSEPNANLAKLDGWQELKETGGLIEDLDSGEMVPLGQTQENKSVEQMGETWYEATTTFDQPGKQAVFLKFAHDFEPNNEIAFEFWQVEISPAESTK